MKKNLVFLTLGLGLIAAKAAQDDFNPDSGAGWAGGNLPGRFGGPATADNAAHIVPGGPATAEVVTHTPVNIPAPGVELTPPENVQISAVHLFGAGQLASPLKGILAGLLLGQASPDEAKKNLAEFISNFVDNAETVAVAHLPIFTRAIVGQVLTATDAQEKTLAAKLAAEIVDALTK